MDEGRETNQVTVNPAILGPHYSIENFQTFTVCDAQGAWHTALSVLDAVVCRGSRTEH